MPKRAHILSRPCPNPTGSLKTPPGLSHPAAAAAARWELEARLACRAPPALSRGDHEGQASSKRSCAALEVSRMESLRPVPGSTGPGAPAWTCSQAAPGPYLLTNQPSSPLPGTPLTNQPSSPMPGTPDTLGQTQVGLLSGAIEESTFRRVCSPLHPMPACASPVQACQQACRCGRLVLAGVTLPTLGLQLPACRYARLPHACLPRVCSVLSSRAMGDTRLALQQVRGSCLAAQAPAQVETWPAGLCTRLAAPDGRCCRGAEARWEETDCVMAQCLHSSLPAASSCSARSEALAENLYVQMERSDVRWWTWVNTSWQASPSCSLPAAVTLSTDQAHSVGLWNA